MIIGVALHYFNAQTNSDKFYRCFTWSDNGQFWNVVYHWGRDGAMGRTNWQTFTTRTAAHEALNDKVDSKLAEGYEFLGKSVVATTPGVKIDIIAVSSKLYEKIGCAPTKLPNGYSVIITEEDDIMDLVS